MVRVKPHKQHARTCYDETHIQKNKTQTKNTKNDLSDLYTKITKMLFPTPGQTMTKMVFPIRTTD
jgi:hypothetical protein